MKKTLIAIAALAATGAFAQSTMTISGQMDAGYAHTTSAGTAKVVAPVGAGTIVNGVPGAAAPGMGVNPKTGAVEALPQPNAVAAAGSITSRGMNTGVHGASRLRFVGVSDLGNGMKANFHLEMQPSFTDGSISGNGLFNRGAWAGLSGSFGEVRLGRQGTNPMGVICTVDLLGCYSGFFGGGILFNGNGAPGAVGSAWIAANPTRGFANTVAAATAQASSTAGDATRYVKSIRYTLPKLVEGLAVNVTNAYGTQDAKSGAAGGGTIGFDGMYAVGPLSVGASYQKAAAEATVDAASGNLTTIGGTYDLGVVKVGALIQRESASAVGAATLAYDNAKAYALTAVYPIGMFTPYFKMGNRSQSLGSSSTTNTKVYNLGARYALSKTTNLYADYANNRATLGEIGAGATDNPKQFSFGMQTTF